MDVIDAAIGRARALSAALGSGDLVRTVLAGHGDDIMELQHMQLLSGRASSGDDIRPYYSEDLKPHGYFHSAETAARYAAWKQGLSYPYTAMRNPDAPNLYIDGTFYSEMSLDFGGEGMEVVGTTKRAREIMGKYGRDTFGLSSENWGRLFHERRALDELIEEARNILE